MNKTQTLETLPHLIQLKQEYKKLEDEFNCVVQEWYTGEDSLSSREQINESWRILNNPRVRGGVILVTRRRRLRPLSV